MDIPEATIAAMERAAREVREKAYAPYSGFPVGACLRAGSEALYAGANVENASYPEGLCAESAALGALVSAGEGSVTAVALYAEGPRLCTPCGGCRQRLAEFAASETPVMIFGPQGLRATFTLADLLPYAFNLDDGTGRDER